MNTPTKPEPRPSAISRGYWEAAAAGRLVLQACGACGKVRHYPQLLCPNCYSDASLWQASDARGTVHSWTVAHHAFHAAFAAELPYTLVTIDLDEGVRALGLWLGGQTPSIGQPVQGRFRPRASGGVDLLFEPRAA